MIKVTFELDYPDMGTAMERNPTLASLISHNACISFEAKKEVTLREYGQKKEEKFEELKKSAIEKGTDMTSEYEKFLESMAWDWVRSNYYYIYKK